MSTYKITYTNGESSDVHHTLDAAKEHLAKRWPDCEIETFEDRTLVWASEEDSIDDDGARAIASIYEVAS